jgi:hypothetical protein
MWAFITTSTLWGNRCSTHLRNALALLFEGRRKIRSRSKQSGCGRYFPALYCSIEPDCGELR